MSITTHETTIKQWVKNHTKDDIALFLGDQFVKKDAEIERLKAENAELRREIGGFPHLSDMRQCMVDAADENERLKNVADQAIALANIRLEYRAAHGDPEGDTHRYVCCDSCGTPFLSALADYLELKEKEK